MALGHLDPGAGVLLQLRDGLAALADDGTSHHGRDQHFEVVRGLHRCGKRSTSAGVPGGAGDVF